MVTDPWVRLLCRKSLGFIFEQESILVSRTENSRPQHVSWMVEGGKPVERVSMGNWGGSRGHIWIHNQL
jgi:hypothetical protein